MLLLSISGFLCPLSFGQTNPFQKMEEYPYNRKFNFSLNKGEWMTMELSDISDIDRIKNIDSLIKAFKKDIQLLKDSLEDGATGKKIDYYSDASGRKQVRIKNTYPSGNSFIIASEELAVLKITQDTVVIAGIITDAPEAVEKMNRGKERIFRFTFYLNDYSNIENYSNGDLNSKVAMLRVKNPSIWGYKRYTHFVKSDTTISASAKFGFSHGPGDYLTPFLTVNLQNYKNHFVPSFNMGATIVLTNRYGNWFHAISAGWEPQFFFQKNTQGKLETFRNDFITLMYGQGPVNKKNPQEEAHLNGFFTVGYLIRNKGSFYDNNTWRFGYGIQVKRTRTNIEPLIYFHDFFKGVTPGVRVLFGF